jgi:arsenate reductase
MAEAFLKSFDGRLEVYSAGTKPSAQVHPKAVLVMREIGIDLGGSVPKNVARFIAQPFDYVITVCDHAREACPVFTGTVAHRLHIGFDDPAEVTGSEEHIMSEFRRIRDEIKERFHDLFVREIGRR